MANGKRRQTCYDQHIRAQLRTTANKGTNQDRIMLRNTALFTLLLLLAGCSSTPKGVDCPGEVSTIYGQPMGQTQARIFDLVNAFTVTRDGVAVKSGTLHSSDRFQYVPSAVTSEGFTAQRLSDKQFRLINPYQNTMITWTCP
jgi:hypothetical protein